MYHWAQCVVFLALATVSSLSEPSPSLHYPNVKADVFDQPVNLMGAKKTAHDKEAKSPVFEAADSNGAWPSYDFSQLDSYLSGVRDAAQDPDSPEHNRIKRRAKRKRSRSSRRRSRHSSTAPTETERKANGTEVPIARKGGDVAERRTKANAKKTGYDTYEPPSKDFETGFVEMPKDLYQAHLRPGVIFRIHMSEAILKMQYRNYGEDKDESVIEADVEYLRLTRKVINDEITKFEDYLWLVEWFTNKTELIQEHVCNTRYMAVGTPPTMFTHPEEYMKRLCLFDNVYIDHIPYVIGDDNSLLAAVAPPVLHCDAATCTSVPFIDSVMFDEKLQRTNVRTVTRCQASCRAHCRNDADCLKRCSDRCLRAE